MIGTTKVNEGGDNASPLLSLGVWSDDDVLPVQDRIFWDPQGSGLKPRRYEGFYISTGSKIFFQTLVFWFLESKM